VAAASRVARESTIGTTTGRKSGKQHAADLVRRRRRQALVQAGKDGKADWYQNLMKTPTATAHQGDYTFRVRGRRVDEPARVGAIHRLFLEKYTSAWLLSFVGSSIGRGRPVELEPISVAVQRGVKR
jgi:hypothetical protein